MSGSLRDNDHAGIADSQTTRQVSFILRGYRNRQVTEVFHDIRYVEQEPKGFLSQSPPVRVTFTRRARGQGLTEVLSRGHKTREDSGAAAESSKQTTLSDYHG